jgi:fibronectin type 3 domain-containing protein
LPQRTGAILLRWATPGGERVATYDVYRSTRSDSFNFLSRYDSTNRIIYRDENTQSGNTYYYVVRSVDEAGNQEGNTDQVSAAAFDYPPGPPRNLRAQLRPNGSVTLMWSIPLDEAVLYYNIYKSLDSSNFSFDDIYDRTTMLTYTDNLVEHGQTYFYIVRAVDHTENEEENTNYVSVTSQDQEAPNPPVDLTATPAGTGTIHLAWAHPAGERPSDYLIYRSQSPFFRPSNQNFLNRTPTTSYLDRDLGDAQTYHYIVRSVDWIGNEDLNENRVPATTPPGPPGGLMATSQQTGEILLVWSPPATLVNAYRVYRSTESMAHFPQPIAEISQPITTHLDSGLNRSQTYHYVVRSVDVRGAEETNTNEVFAVSIPPLPPTGLQATGQETGEIRLIWTLPGVPVKGFSIFRSNRTMALDPVIPVDQVNQVGEVEYPSNSYTDPGLVHGQTYYYIVRSIDFDGAQDNNTNEVFATSNETIPPVPPVNLTSSQMPSGAIHLAWDHTDLEDVSIFNIYRFEGGPGLALAAFLTSTNATSYQDTQVTSDQTYSYLVRAVDVHGNEEKNVDWTSNTSIDILPPPAPSGLAADSLAGGSIELAWTAPQERNLTYNIYRTKANATDAAGNATLLATTNLTGYTDAGLTNGVEYFYTVRAVDLAGNEERNDMVVSAVSSKGGPRALLALALVAVFILGGYMVDRRRRAAEAG